MAWTQIFYHVIFASKKKIHFFFNLKIGAVFKNMHNINLSLLQIYPIIENIFISMIILKT